MRGRAAGVGDEPGDLGEQHHPRRVGHLADEDVAVADLVELVDRSDDPGGAFEDAGRRPEAGDQPFVVRLLLVEAVRVAPVDEIRERHLRRRDRADPVARVEALRRLAFQPAGGHDLPGRDRIGAADQAAKLVVAKEHDVVRLVEPAGLDELPADHQQHEPEVGVRALVDVEVVVGRQWRHPQVDGVGRQHLLPGRSGQPLEDLARGGLDVEAHRLDRASDSRSRS